MKFVAMVHRGEMGGHHLKEFNSKEEAFREATITLHGRIVYQTTGKYVQEIVQDTIERHEDL